MFKRSFRSQDPSRVDKAARLKKNNSVRDPQKLSRLQRSLTEETQAKPVPAPAVKSNSLAPAPIVTLTVGREGRLFAAHEDVLRQAPAREYPFPTKNPEVFSAVLEYLYKGDYYPRLRHNKHRNSWELENAVRGTPQTSPYVDTYTPGGGRAAASPASAASPAMGPQSDATVYVAAYGQHLLRDTAVYCSAERYGLEELKRLALRKQGLQSGIDVGTILRSAQYAYAHTPDSDSRLRAHYLALIIRCRKTFKRSGTMQAEMERGGSKLFFDLFVAMCNHLDDVIDVSNARSPKTV
ncbi:hypothetical protein HYQ45_016913 [Verticillium longisporum]|uniref:BTB domain-containing protein n=1 Tax=Verticillium longisporum TaxID=100787 RepID=A0A8I2Z555_VERLO|nr:hypothetical protein HYQ45_016913 [Verticillium longisporum]